ncbi:MAG: NAD-dependent epimerase/dehydratase family protein [Phycisphaerales bacterium]|nr:NAD-dependent epimerase/dehydratase family protein [Phycisphaerales bacterium]
MLTLVTGSSGLIGSEAVTFFDAMGFDVLGVDNNMRADFFGPKGDTSANRARLESTCPRFTHRNLDIRDRDAVARLFRNTPFDLVIHAAAQPSHDLAAKRVFDDFEVNALATLNLLEACRIHRPDAVFIHVSTNKVYGDKPNTLPLVELETRYDYADPAFSNGIDETLSIDNSTHSLFGVSKTAGDLLAQEYGRYFGLKTGIFRGGCLTGPQHAGVELHGFLNYLVATALQEGPYTIFGYKGKQVRDQIHCHDVISAFWAFAQAPRPGEVYNLGGGKHNAASLLECIERIATHTGKRPRTTYDPTNRIGDHICYYTNMAKFRSHYPQWTQEYTLDRIVSEMVACVQDASIPA